MSNFNPRMQCKVIGKRNCFPYEAGHISASGLRFSEYGRKFHSIGSDPFSWTMGLYNESRSDFVYASAADCLLADTLQFMMLSIIRQVGELKTRITSAISEVSTHIVCSI